MGGSKAPDEVMFALFRNGQQLGRQYLQWRSALDEALNRGLLKKASDTNFILVPYCEIRQVASPVTSAQSEGGK